MVEIHECPVCAHNNARQVPTNPIHIKRIANRVKL